MAEKKKRKIRVMILWVLLLAIVIGIGTLVLLQWNNIQAVWVRFQYSQEERQALLNRSQDDIQKILDDLNLSNVTPLTLEQESLLTSGSLSEEEALQLIMGKEQSGGTDSAALEQLMARIYLLRSTFVGKLDALEAQARQEYIENDGNVVFKEFAQRFLGQGTALESQCDAQMEQILAEMKRELIRIGKDMTLISEIRTTYETEKSVKKAALLEKYW